MKIFIIILLMSSTVLARPPREIMRINKEETKVVEVVEAKELPKLEARQLVVAPPPKIETTTTTQAPVFDYPDYDYPYYPDYGQDYGGYNLYGYDGLPNYYDYAGLNLEDYPLDYGQLSYDYNADAGYGDYPDNYGQQSYSYYNNFYGNYYGY